MRMKVPAAKNQSGQVLVLLAFTMVVLVGILAMAMDGGLLYLTRRRMQNAADAGALAGGRILALNGTTAQAYAAAYDYAVTRNRAATADISISSPSISVRACKPVDLTFSRVLGINRRTVCATAGGRFDGVAEAGGAAPIAIRDFAYVKGRTYTIWDDDADVDPMSGNIQGSYRGWLCMTCVNQDCGACGESLLKTWMRDGYNGTMSVGTWIRGETGVAASVIQQARVGQILTIVVFDQKARQFPGKDYYHSIKLAAFKVEAVMATGNPKGIRGQFIDYVVSGPPSPTDGGLRMVHLEQ